MTVHSHRSCNRRHCAAQQGFTLIELLVVVVMLAVLTSIALPSFLNQATRAKQANALKYIGVMNRAQQAFFLENSRFAASAAELGFANSPNGSDDYTYAVITDPAGLNITSTKAIPADSSLRGYAGVVFITLDAGGGARVDAMICQGTAATPPTPTPVTVAGEVQITNCNTL